MQDQTHAQEAASFFKDRILLEIHSDIETIEKRLWEELQMIPLVQLGPHGPMGPHVPVIEVWGTLL